MSEQPRPPTPPADPIRALENTRRTLLKLVENIEAALEAARRVGRIESTGRRPTRQAAGARQEPTRTVPALRPINGQEVGVLMIGYRGRSRCAGQAARVSMRRLGVGVGFMARWKRDQPITMAPERPNQATAMRIKTFMSSLSSQKTCEMDARRGVASPMTTIGDDDRGRVGAR